MQREDTSLDVTRIPSGSAVHTHKSPTLTYAVSSAIKMSVVFKPFLAADSFCQIKVLRTLIHRANKSRITLLRRAKGPGAPPSSIFVSI